MLKTGTDKKEIPASNHGRKAYTSKAKCKPTPEEMASFRILQAQLIPPGIAITEELMKSAHFIIFMSFKLSGSETRFVTGERETSAVVRGLAECRWLVIESPFPVMVYNDHQNLLNTFSNDPEAKSRITIWLKRLRKYQIEVHH